MTSSCKHGRYCSRHRETASARENQLIRCSSNSVYLLNNQVFRFVSCGWPHGTLSTGSDAQVGIGEGTATCHAFPPRVNNFRQLNLVCARHAGVSKLFLFPPFCLIIRTTCFLCHSKDDRAAHRPLRRRRRAVEAPRLPSQTSLLAVEQVPRTA